MYCSRNLGALADIALPIEPDDIEMTPPFPNIDWRNTGQATTED